MTIFLHMLLLGVVGCEAAAPDTHDLPPESPGGAVDRELDVLEGEMAELVAKTQGIRSRQEQLEAKIAEMVSAGAPPGTDALDGVTAELEAAASELEAAMREGEALRQRLEALRQRSPRPDEAGAPPAP